MEIQGLEQSVIAEMGDYGINKEKYLSQFVSHQDDENHHTDEKFWAFINLYEQYVFHFADRLSEGKYNGGLWLMENGYFELKGADDVRYEVSGNYHTAQLNLVEFSLLVNLMALSHLSINAYSKGNNFVNNLAVFFSDYCKAILRANAEKLDVSSIQIILD
jgi:membrane protease subunit (stomatin/prohibitin family)